jgi:hypothetical protein
MNLLQGFNVQIKLDREIVSINASTQSFNVSTNVRFRVQELSFMRIQLFGDVFVRHDDVRLVRFHLTRQITGIETKRRTISSVSQRVPEPRRRTSSGFIGMMLQSEKINGFTYFMYK